MTEEEIVTPVSGRALQCTSLDQMCVQKQVDLPHTFTQGEAGAQEHWRNVRRRLFGGAAVGESAAVIEVPTTEPASGQGKGQEHAEPTSPAVKSSFLPDGVHDLGSDLDTSESALGKERADSGQLNGEEGSKIRKTRLSSGTESSAGEATQVQQSVWEGEDESERQKKGLQKRTPEHFGMEKKKKVGTEVESVTRRLLAENVEVSCSKATSCGVNRSRLRPLPSTAGTRETRKETRIQGVPPKQDRPGPWRTNKFHLIGPSTFLSLFLREKRQGPN